jgi:voltage-gated potassium channel
MYHIENSLQPELFSSIPAAMWWSIITFTTVGYGDTFPVTAFGRALAAFIAILGIGFFAIPTGIIGAGFVQEMNSKAGSRNCVCPHCGKEYEAKE